MKAMTHWLIIIGVISIHCITAGNARDFVQTFERANDLFRDNKIPESIEAYKSAIAIKDDVPEAHFNLGLALEREKTGRSSDY